MARIVSVGAALQNLYLVDHDDLKSTSIGESSILGNILVGTETNIDKANYLVGGSALNSAISFARHGHETILISNIGYDAAGDSILRALDKESVDTSYINYNKRISTGISVILLDAKSNERTTLTCKGASRKFSNLIPSDLETIYPDWIFVTSLDGDLEKTQEFFEKAKSMDTKVAYFPNTVDLEDTNTCLKMLKNVDLLILNKANAAKLVPGTTLAELIEHLKGYVKTVIITDGPMGGIATDSKETYRFGIYEDVNVKDNTGAGAAFASGFLAHFADNNTFKNSLEFASANATSVIQKISPNEGILTGKEKLHPMPIQKL